MSKNLTRKGLALGALVALASTVFAGTPATAATTGFTLAPNAGTSVTSIAGATFDLASTIDSAIFTSTKSRDKVSFLVTNAGAAELTVYTNGLSTDANDSKIRTADTTDAIAVASTDTTDAAKHTAKVIVVGGKATNPGVGSDSVLKNHLFIGTSADATADVVVKAQAFIDENSNGKIDSNDPTSPEVIVTYKPFSTVAATTSITSATIGGTTIAAKVAVASGVNMENLGTNVKVGFTFNGSKLYTRSSVSATDGSSDAADVSWDGVDSLVSGALGVLSTDASDTTVRSIFAGTIVAQAYFQSSANKLGTSSAASAPANGTLSADSMDWLDTTASANVYNRVTGASVNSTDVRADFTGDVTFGSKVTWHSNDNTEKAAPAGVTVKVTLSKVALATASTFTAGGVTLTATSGDVSFTTTTDADGKIAFTGKGTGAKDDSIKVSVAALKKTGGYTSMTRSTIVTYVAAAASSLVNTNLVGANAVLNVAKGSTYTLTYVVKDQFGQVYTGAKYRATLVASANAAFTYRADSVDGKITQVVVDNSVATTGYNVTSTNLQKWNTTTLDWDAAGSIAVPTVAVVNHGLASAAVTATASASTAQATIQKTLVSVDRRVDTNTTTTTTIGYGSSATQTISGYVTASTGAAVPGAVVTVAATGLGFVVNSASYYAVGSVTVNADANGFYSVDVYSTTAGKATVTVTSGAATKTAAIEFSGITSMAETNVLSLDVASLSQVGRSVTVTVKLVDKYGNAVDTADAAIAIAVTGVGSLSAATVGTDSTGKATVQFVAGANDFGDAVITAKYTATDAAATVVTATKTLTVGVTDAQVDIVGKRVTAVASFSKGKTVGFYVDGVKKWSKLSASDADVVLNYNLKKGTHTITVKISGGFVTTEKFIVK